ncbi:hypothetical protein [Roseovarius sp. 217]|uniref:hypothetical protein n=1 Tax=Roseovarius sp. (strain 217) TaxID=314264 RepID=UPI000068582B|nr:hypothetical protein [Roseovarius sp. 217]EAQ27426.1 hypothetical protein ROS217_22907 [Roseovarius sp. 217]KJS43933.1 MAG: hypothetical protein VR71_08145 [Roseovarius sp. BRH_c41]
MAPLCALSCGVADHRRGPEARPMPESGAVKSEPTRGTVSGGRVAGGVMARSADGRAAPARAAPARAA